jgi:hypothetical protein
MTRIIAVAALVLAAMLPAVTAQAQLVRTFVSQLGSDTNPCTGTQPCHSFAAAYLVTQPGGIITALDPGGYGPLTITMAITIDGLGWAGITGSSGGNAITINAGASDTVVLRGLNLTGISGSFFGILLNSGGTLSVQNGTIQNFQGGISLSPTASTPIQLFVSNTLVSNNSSHAISTSGATAPTTGVLDHVRLVNNGGDGLLASDGAVPGATMNITVSDSVIANNAFYGIIAVNATSSSVSVMVRNSTIANNLIGGLAAQFTGATIRVTRSTITGNTTAWAALSSGTVISYGDNNIDGNGAANTAPPQIGYK